jgi:hypothetical protein
MRKAFIVSALAAVMFAAAGCVETGGGEEPEVDGIEVTSIEYGVDAATKDVVLDDLDKHEPFTVGSYLLLEPFNPSQEPGTKGLWSVFDAKGAKLSEEGYIIESYEHEFPDDSIPGHFFELLPINKPLVSHTIYKLGDSGIVYHMFIVLNGGETGNSSITHAYIAVYEDMTEYYRTKYPTAGVNAVVRTYVFNPWS